MGSKKIKAIVVDDQGGAFQKPNNPEGFRAAVQEAVELIRHNPRIKFFHAYGTAGITPIDQGRGSLPTRNYRLGSFERFSELGGEKMLELMEPRGGKQGHGCMPGCLTKCSNVFHDVNREYVTSALEYETLSMLGSNLEIGDMDAVAMMDRQCDDYGLDTIEIGAAMGILAETDYFEFGNPEWAMKVIDEIGRGSILGRVLGQGVATTCKVFGVHRVPAVKGQAIPGHSARSMKGLGVTYATSPQGADHTAGFVADAPLSSDGQIERSRKAQIDALLMDTAGFCYFNFLQGNRELMVKLLNGLHGLDCQEGDVLNMAIEALKEEICFNRKAGISEAEDRLPLFLSTEPLPPTNAVFDIPKEDLEKTLVF
jgi:aldehyde:ferredoxin oxidoreductase